MVFRYAKKKKEGKFLQGDQISDKERARERSDLKIPLERKLNQLFIEWFFSIRKEEGTFCKAIKFQIRRGRKEEQDDSDGEKKKKKKVDLLVAKEVRAFDIQLSTTYLYIGCM